MGNIIVDCGLVCEDFLDVPGLILFNDKKKKDQKDTYEKMEIYINLLHMHIG
jgi:hypothetical protein